MALSPSRFANDLSAPPPSLPQPKKRMIFQEEDDFLFDSMLEEAEQGYEEPPEEDEEDLYAAAPPSAQLPQQPVASSSSSPGPGLRGRGAGAASRLEEEFGEEVFVRRSQKEGKKKLVLSPEEGFEDGMDLDSALGRDATSAQASLTHDYTSRYADLSTVNLNYRPNYIHLDPISATSFDGRQVQFSRRKRVDAMDYSDREAKENSAALAKLSSSMLEEPYHRMIQRIKDEKKNAEADATNANVDVDTGSIIETQLWTDRYRPKKFTDLLGDDRVHRAALLWLKEWDQCVFKDKASGAADMKRERRKKRARDGKSGFGASASGGGGTEERAPDMYGRPHEKILLLCGPPGLGKTTLAYVLARQAGYQVLEVNASDDRTGKVVEERIKNALESTALSSGGASGGKSRPTCVVIDEVDGAGGGGETSFIRTLVKLVEHGSSTKKYKGKGKKDVPLLRPIICICNDLYAPVLRPLRPLARIIRFSAPTNVMLVKRLKTICEEETLGIDTKSLTLLSDVAEGDLRTCLNTLQFIKRNSKVVSEEVVRKAIVELKDSGMSPTTVVERLFKKPPRKKGGNGDEDRFVHRIVKDVQTCGEYEKISSGCFENYLGAKQINDAFPRILDSLDWLFLYDRLNGRLNAERDYELLPYVPYTFAPWYKLFSSHAQKALEYPKADYEAYLKRLAHQEIVDNFALSIPQSLKTSFTGGNIAAELLPLLNRIISPTLKPVNSQLIKAEERVVMLKLINTMLAMNLSFVHDKDEDGQLTYKLEPQIDVFVHFEGKRATDIVASRYAVRHLVNHEMEAERLRRSSTNGGVLTTANDILAAYKLKPDQGVQPAVKDAVDFFGRIIASKPITREEAAAPPPPKRTAQAVYRFHEGFSNAVRVTKRVSDFML